LPDILTEGFRQLPLRSPLLDVRTIQFAHVLPVKDRLHWADLPEEIPQCVQILFLQHSSGAGGFVGIIRKDIPRGEVQRFKRCQRQHLGHGLLASILLERNTPQLRKGADRSDTPSPDRLYPGEKGCGNRAQPGQQYQERSGMRNHRFPSATSPNNQCSLQTQLLDKAPLPPPGPSP
jgi:hypothetical protein